MKDKGSERHMRIFTSTNTNEEKRKWNEEWKENRTIECQTMTKWHSLASLE